MRLSHLQDIESKTCTKCLKHLPINAFWATKARCIDCEKSNEPRRLYRLAYYQRNKEQIKAKVKRHIKTNPEMQRARSRKYSATTLAKKKKEDPLVRYRFNLRSVIRLAIAARGTGKNGRTSVSILGCSWEAFRRHIESQFEPWMDWSIYGKCDGLKTGFDIDHIIPLSSGRTTEEILALCHYSNLQPLCSYTNRFIKRNRMDFKNTERLCTSL